MAEVSERLRDPQRTNREFWDADADDYQAVHGAQLARGGRWGVWGIPESELGAVGDLGGLDVLELGCGGAQLSLGLALDARTVIGLDQSGAQLAHAALNARVRSLRMPLVCATATNVPLRDASFDVIYCDHGAMSFCDPYETVPEAARLLRPGGLLAFNTSTLLRLLCFPAADPDAPLTRRLHGRYFGAHLFDWGDGTVDFQIPHGAWIRLFRANGLEVEDLIELRPPKGARTTYLDYADRRWARRWPAEEIWKVRKPEARDR